MRPPAADQPTGCRIAVHEVEDRCVMRVTGELDALSEGVLERAIDDIGAGRIELDLSHLRFLDVRGYHAVQRALGRADRDVTIRATNRWYDRIDDLVREGPLDG